MFKLSIAPVSLVQAYVASREADITPAALRISLWGSKSPMNVANIALRDFCLADNRTFDELYYEMNLRLQ